MVRALIYYLGTLFINRKVWQHYKRLKVTQNSNIEDLKKNQLVKLKELLTIAYSKSSFYKQLYDSHGITINDLNSLEDLKKLPIISKSDLLNNTNNIHTCKNFDSLIFSETSGSTGENLGFYRTKDWDASTRGAMFRGYSWYNVKPWEKNGYFWGYNLSNSVKIKFLDFLQNRFRIFTFDKHQIRVFIKKLEKASFLEGYSSMIFEVAKIINSEKNPYKFKLKMIKGTSEKIFDYYNIEVKKAFGKNIVSEYGSAETGIIAFECPYGNMHITMENVIVEVENDEIIVTNLYSVSFPIIRYKLGDYVKLSETMYCPCGMKHEIIDEVYGRVGNVIKGFNQDFPSLVLYYIFKNLALEHKMILKYQVIQKKVGHLIINITNNLNETEINLVKKEIRKYFKEEIVCEINDKKEAIRSSGKIRDFISEL
jgi:phenylacetate-CoA ligase